MDRFTFVMLFDSLIDVFGKANIIALRIRCGADDVNVEHAVPPTMADRLRPLKAGLPAVAPALAGRKVERLVDQTRGPPPFGGRRTMADRLRPERRSTVFGLVGFGLACQP
jgi:hypothetical protein